MASCQQSNGGLLSCECDRCDIVTISGWFVARAVQNVDHGWVSAGNPRQNRTTDWDQEGRDRGEHHFKPLLAECAIAVSHSSKWQIPAASDWLSTVPRYDL